MFGTFNGRWADPSGFHAAITGDGGTVQIQYTDVPRGPFPGHEVEGSISIQFSDAGQTVRGVLQNGGQNILWDNGTVWTRQGPSVSELANLVAVLQSQLSVAVRGLIRRGATFAEVGGLLGIGDWVQIAQGGNTKPGIIGGLDQCPCQKEYTVATNQVAINAWPNPAQVNACNNAPPAAEKPGFKCADNCIQVMTHLWHGWTVMQNTKTGQILFNCETFAQYHCKKPDDPDVNKPPIPTDPNDPNPTP
jgi:hypothetical protein